MRMYDLIEKKRDGGTLSARELRWLVEGYTAGSIPDYQMAAFLMAVYYQGMSQEETLEFTMAMADSGERLKLSDIQGVKVDKHSTGGIGDKVSLVLSPIVAACGVKVAKMSGRGLGFTGGTIDKLESIPGFSTNLSREQFIRQVNKVGFAIMGQTSQLAPADKKIYALRDLTATVESMPLIASSIMSKKLAAGADGIVLDVKCGDGAFMKTREAARQLADTMIAIGTGAGKMVEAVLSDMNQPLGYAVGNALEVKEAIYALQGNGPEDLMETCYELGAHMLCMAGQAKDKEAAVARMKEAVATGAALQRFRAMIAAQQGDETVIENPDKLPRAAYEIPVLIKQTGVITGMCCKEIGTICMQLGGGRKKKEDAIDPAVGIVLCKKANDKVASGETVAVIHSNHLTLGHEMAEKLEKTITVA